jgi:hypothetical protein
VDLQEDTDLFVYLQQYGSTPDLVSYRKMNFHFSVGEAKGEGETLGTTQAYNLIKENNGLYAAKGRASYITGTELQPVEATEMLIIKYDLRLDGGIWNKPSSQVNEDDSALMKVYGADFDLRNLKTTTPCLVQFGPVYDYIDGEELSKMVLEF